MLYTNILHYSHSQIQFFELVLMLVAGQAPEWGMGTNNDVGGMGEAMQVAGHVKRFS